MRVDVARQNEFAGAIDLLAEPSGILLAHRDAFDLVTVDHHRRVRQHFPVARVNHRRADERNSFGANTRRREE